ncbi:MAG TPA: TrkH family potassium uptake protein [Psychromonas hadalis]|nr:TrkH family potassium uptake protein [Psychromonas hadalis]
MNYRPLFLITGAVLSKIAFFMLFPLALAYYTKTLGTLEFALAMALTFAASGFLVYFGKEKEKSRLGIREMFMITTLVWVLSSLFAALPFVFIEHISYSDAFFETMSGITTTGSTVLHGLDTMPPSILLWRSLLQWIGGVGFIVMGVAILPFLNVGGMKLFQTESSDWSDKEETRAKYVALGILSVYTILTFLCFLGYLYAGMTIFEAINHSMTTLSTGGYSTSDGSLGHFSKAAHWNGTLFMFLGGLPFLLFVRSFNRANIRTLIFDAQVIGFTKFVLFSAGMLTLYLVFTDQFSWEDAIRLTLFNVISVMTTTGFGLDDFTTWGDFGVMVFFGLLFVGACSGSTAGGIKIFRFQIAISLLKRELMMLMHPRGIFPQKYNNRKVGDDILRSMIVFVLAYFITIMIATLLLTLLGTSAWTSLTAAITAVSNVGPGLTPEIGPSGNFAFFSDTAKWILSVCMLLGRLEILTVMVLFSRHFWRL